MALFAVFGMLGSGKCHELMTSPTSAKRLVACDGQGLSYCEVLGTQAAMNFPECWLQPDTNCCMCPGDLEESVRAKMSSEASCNRLRESLNTMRRIGLLEKEERPDQAGHVQGPASDGVVYVAQPSASLELPANMSQGLSLQLTPEQFRHFKAMGSRQVRSSKVPQRMFIKLY